MVVDVILSPFKDCDVTLSSLSPLPDWVRDNARLKKKIVWGRKKGGEKRTQGRREGEEREMETVGQFKSLQETRATRYNLDRKTIATQKLVSHNTTPWKLP